ncbi:hypothetical protein MASR2M36_37350 [Providencia sp.]
MKAYDADLIPRNGMNLEVCPKCFFENLKNVPAVVVTEGIEPMPIREGEYKDNPNPHAWMSPANAKFILKIFAKR